MAASSAAVGRGVRSLQKKRPGKFNDSATDQPIPKAQHAINPSPPSGRVGRYWMARARSAAVSRASAIWLTIENFTMSHECA